MIKIFITIRKLRPNTNPHPCNISENDKSCKNFCNLKDCINECENSCVEGVNNSVMCNTASSCVDARTGKGVVKKTDVSVERNDMSEYCVNTKLSNVKPNCRIKFGFLICGSYYG